jgi:hypothetical protein
MEKDRIVKLIASYNKGSVNPSEARELEQLIELGEVSLTQLHNLNKFDELLERADFGSPSLRLDEAFCTMLKQEKKKQKAFSFRIPEWNILFTRLAFAASFLLIGFVAAYLFNERTASTSVQQLTQEVSDLKEMMMLSLLEKESATERLRAVSLTNDMEQASEKVTNALLITLNNDENVNVRLAALDALKSYVGDSAVRMALVKSIAKQESPLVQVALAELMAAMQERNSLKEFEELLKDTRTPEDVKKRIKENLQVII